MPKPLSLIAFDLDGTLIDSLADFAAAMNRNLAKYGLPQRETEEYRYIVGGGALNGVRRACPEGTGEDTIQALWRDFNADYRENGCVRTRPYPGIAESVQALKAAGVPMAVLTNKTHDLAVSVTDRLFPPDTFAAILGNNGSIPLKPKPDMGLWLGRQLGIPAEATAYVGDSGSDMTFALAAGFTAVGAAWGFRGRGELEAAGAEIILQTPSELPGLVVK